MYLRPATTKDFSDYEKWRQELHKQNYMNNKVKEIPELDHTEANAFKKMLADKKHKIFMSTNKENTYTVGYVAFRINKDNIVIEQIYVKNKERPQLINKVFDWCRENSIHRVYSRCKKWNTALIKDLENSDFEEISSTGDWLFFTHYIK